MKKSLCVCALLLCCACGIAQLVPNNGFYNSMMVPCPGNPSVQVQGYQEWEFYQTYNDEWDGVKDSDNCISIIPGNLGCKIPLVQIDTLRRFFIASKPINNSYLAPHVVYNLPLDVGFIGTFNIQGGLDSAGQTKSFILSVTRIPDVTGLDTTYLLQKVALDPVDTPSWEYFTYNTCMASTKFDDQYLKRVVSGIKFSQANTGDTLVLKTFGSYFYTYAETYSEIQVPQFSGNFETTIGGGFDPSLIIYDASGYPSVTNIDAALVTPFPDPGIPVNMVIQVNAVGELIFEPYTKLQAAEVSGQPGVFHTFTLINSGGEVCANFVELIFQHGDEFRYQSGGINLNGSPSCFRFMNGAKMHVMSGSELNYGTANQSGILLMNDAAELIIDPGGTLNIWNRMMLREEHPEYGAKQLYMTLNTGATLRFMPGSHLLNLYSADNSIHLNVFMRGGILDDSGLPESEKLLINRIYDETVNAANPMQLFPNPARDYVDVHCMGSLINDIIISDIMGRTVYESDESGYQIHIKINNPEAGTYFIKCITNEGTYIKQLAIQ
ncbi:MAG: T9SS type A sorting domain-containing protein [Chitinophagaceae bacterium]|nr:T9SS type A sorting domain-containing protein [Chitinophagaceae bacterium]